MNEMGTIDDFGKLDIRIGKIVSVEKAANTDKLLILQVDFGSEPEGRDRLRTELSERSGDKRGKNIRQIVSGIAQWYTPEDLVGKECPFIVNLEPRTFRGIESQGMLVATEAEGGAVLLHPDKEVPEGSRIK